MAQPGGSQYLQFTFLDASTGQPADPASLQLDITFGGEVGTVPDVAGPFTYSGASSPGVNVVYRTGTGQYAFNWGLPGNLPAGVYTANWTASYGGTNWLATENFTVTPAGAIAGMAALLPLEPNDELVAIAWLSTIPGLSKEIVATTLPPPVLKGKAGPAPWVQTGFVTVSVVGGSPDVYNPINRPVLQVDCWATKPGSGKPPWWLAAGLASAIRRACWERLNVSRPLALSAGPEIYPSAIVRVATLVTAFRRLYADQADYARYQADLQLDWIKVPDQFD